MINTLLKRQRFIAAFLLAIIYLETVLPQVAYGRQASFYPEASYTSYTGNSNLPAGTEYTGNPVTETRNGPAGEAMPQAEDIGGPGQPEMSSFSSVNASNMVDLFTGDFSYNLPLMDVGGYPVNIHYSSGISMDQEASWVGLGWNINPGTIGRTTRGLPDDFDGTDMITRTQNIKPNKTVGANLGAGVELAGLPINVGAHLGVFHNNYNGWGIEHGVNASISAGGASGGSLTASLALNNNSQTGLDVSPSLSIGLGRNEGMINGSVTIGSNYNSRMGISGLQLNTEVRGNVPRYKQKAESDDLERLKNTSRSASAPSSFISFATPSYLPTITMPLTNKSTTLKIQLGGEVWSVNAHGYIEGYVSEQYIRQEDREQRLPAYGYLNFSKATQAKALLDFNREKDIAFNAKSSPHIAIPQYSYDIYSISGEGTGGMFRPYRGDAGYIFDHEVKTKSERSNISVDLGYGGGVHIGTDFVPIDVTTTTGAWKGQNNLLGNIAFAKRDSTFEEVYFRNPGEKAINTSSFYSRLGGDSLVRVKLSGSDANVQALSALTKFSGARPSGDIAINSPLLKQQRDKRTQVITYLNAGDASMYGLDRQIRSYDTSSNPVTGCDGAYRIIPRTDETVRKAHHLSEIKVLNGDGRIYVYGLPVYNVEQRDVTFSVDKETDNENLDKGLVHYTPDLDNSTSNNKGKDSYFNRDITPAYAHSFLLTGLVSPDYVDIKNDGITDDDLGDAVKFNYTELYGAHNGYYGWRTPFDSDKANYNEGLKTYGRDDKGTYMYGKKEVWYLHSIESKTMIALFQTSDRTDAYSVEDENGTKDPSKKLKRLDSIELFTKADLAKNGNSARPVKTVHFEYSYELCQNATGEGTSGKLTLKKIWFTYNGNNKGKLNPYQFYYHPDAANNNLPESAYNPSHNSKTYDRWGNYKDPAGNPGSLNNIDYPYAVQDSAKAAIYSSAWHLTDIKLPSGGRMHVTFEGDDYAYVQNKRATQFFRIAGFSNTTSDPQSYLYLNSTTDCNYVFVNVPVPVDSKKDIYNKYLEGIEKIYFKVAVKMPSDQWGSGYEFVPVYGEIDSYDVVSGNNNQFWIKLKLVDNQSPVAKAAIQFLRLNLPSKAYPTSELGENFDAEAAIKMLASSFSEIKNTVEGFDKAAKSRSWCREIVDSISFIRLDNPSFKKYGGGIRVKKVEIYDNWNAMTARPGSAGLKESVYGQEYTYTTTKDVNGEKILISSGVASYEPMIGGEENPFRTPIEYVEKVAPLAPANYMYTEKLFCESLFPSPMVGYSKVRVRTINAKAKSANGWDETEFYTSKDFPTIVEFTPLDGDSKKRYNPVLKNLLKINAKHYLTVSQGFKVELNDMNGKIKSQSSYKENDPVNAIHYTANYYKTDNPAAYQLHLNNTVWVADSTSGHISTDAEIGHEAEVMFDVRQQQSLTNTQNTAANVDIIFPFVPPWIPILVIPGFYTFPQREEDRFRSVAVLKVIQRYGILDSVVVRDKGSIVSTKNLLYDGETGNPLITRTNNEFNDPVYNFNYPAHWAYSGMGMAYKNIDAIYTGKKIIEGKIMEMDGTAFPAEKYFESGDEVIGTGTERTSQTTIENDCPQDNFDGPADKPLHLWAIEAGKAKEGDKGIFFIDSLGRPYSGKNVTLQILRSGKRNFTDAFVGGITSLSNPVREVSPGIFKIVIDSNTKVINTTAATFKDLWKVENSLYEADSCVNTTSSGSVYGLRPEHTMTLLSTNPFDPRAVPENLSLPDKIVASYSASPKSGHIQNHITRALLKFNLGSIPSNATVTSAKINFYGMKPGDIWGFGIWKTDMQYSYEGIRENFQGNLFSYPDPWDGIATPSFWQWSHSYTDPLLPKAVLPYLGNFNGCENFTNIECGPVIQDLIHKPANLQNMILKINNEWYTDGGSGELRFMSFCGRAYGTPAKDLVGGCADCTPVSLDINYTYAWDTCYKVCRYNINDTAVNPYRWGILGNWRPDRAYTYYYDRAESDAGITGTDIRKEGELKNFIPFWQLGPDSITATTDSSRWVWNSASNLYNRKGYEIENYDPLGRYNSGLYGYNQTLPVAVAQNSKYREILFDGFEDYGYKADNCDAACQTPREIDFLKGNSSASIQNTISHSGRNSLIITANNQAVLTAGITNDTLLVPALFFGIDSTPVYETKVTGKGTGLYTTYSCVGSVGTPLTRIEKSLRIFYDTASLPACEQSTSKTDRTKGYIAVFQGKIQPKFTDNYSFYVNASESQPGIIVNGQLLLAEAMGSTGVQTSTSIYLEAGKLYDIRIEYPRFTKLNGRIDIGWYSPRYQVRQTIPQANLYPPNITAGDTAGSVQRNIIKYCLATTNVIPENIINPGFSPVAGKRMVASVWINTNAADCSNPADNPVPEGQAIISFEGSATTFTLEKTGVAIDGWQRYETVVDIPADATKIYITLKSHDTNATYFDDIRLHPYNSNMKSFVYDPESLRLMAELDENNYASFYEYDDDGTLIRVKKETERGIKTIKESRSALFKEE